MKCLQIVVSRGENIALFSLLQNLSKSGETQTLLPESDLLSTTTMGCSSVSVAVHLLSVCLISMCLLRDCTKVTALLALLNLLGLLFNMSSVSVEFQSNCK